MSLSDEGPLWGWHRLCVFSGAGKYYAARGVYVPAPPPPLLDWLSPWGSFL